METRKVMKRTRWVIIALLLVGLGMCVGLWCLAVGSGGPPGLAFASETGEQSSAAEDVKKASSQPSGTNQGREAADKAASGQQTSNKEKEAEAEVLKEFGEKAGKPIDSGFVFFDGRYLDAPYIVRRRGLKVFINDAVVFECSQWPLPDLTAKKDPGFPEGLTEKHSLEDLWTKEGPWKGHSSRKYLYLHQHFPEDVAIKKLAEYYKSLPFVKSVTYHDRVSLRIEQKNGGGAVADVGAPTPGSVSSGEFTKKDVLERLKRRRQRFEKHLKTWGCYFFFSNGQKLSLGPRKSANDLNLIVEILRSKKPKKEKISLLQRLRVCPPRDLNYFSALVSKFQTS
ncbi:MAG: hypothetical protein QGD94_07520, partial [Planctomycetia bacterium]|nr:hypothetical protein [Planctomycetia bacterium]